MGRSRDEFEDKMARWQEEKAVETVIALLAYREKHGRPFAGITEELAELVGIHPASFGQVLVTARSPEFVRKHGYVIPYVKKGPGAKEWYAIASHEPLDVLVIKGGETIRKRDALTAMKRILAQSEYRSPTFDGRTSSGRREREAMVQMEAALISLEQSLDSH